MLALQGHLRRRLASRRGFPSARPGAGAPLSGVRRPPRFAPTWAWGAGGPLPVPMGRSGTPGYHSGLQGQRAPGRWGWERGVRPPPPPLGPVARGSASKKPPLFFPRHFSLCFFFLSFFFSLSLSIRRSMGRRESQALNPVFGVWSNRVTICLGSRVLLPPTFHRFWTRVPSPPVCGEWPSRAADGMECLSHSPWPGKEEWGMGTIDFFLPPSKLP